VTRAAALLALFLVGCAGDRYALGPEWAPLEEIAELDLPLVPDSAITTIGKRCLVADLDEFLGDHPPGSADFDAIMLHEQAHAVRQRERGLTAWLAAYLADRDFAWAEEQVGWAIELQHLRARGALTNPPEYYASILARYRNARGQLVSYEAALEWVRFVLAQP
jgi:hypothetical protein